MKTDEELKQLAQDFKTGLCWTDRLCGDDGVCSFENAFKKLSETEMASLAKAIQKDGEFFGTIYQYREKAVPFTYKGRPIFDTFEYLTGKEVATLNKFLKELETENNTSIN